MFSKKLEAKQDLLKALVSELGKTFEYVSVLGTDHKTLNFSSNKKDTNISRAMDNDFGYVVKMTNGKGYYEYSFDQPENDIPAFAEKILSYININSPLSNQTVSNSIPEDEALVKSFEDDSDLYKYSESEIIEIVQNLKNKVLEKKSDALNVAARISTVDSSKIFVSKNRFLKQHYSYILAGIVIVSGENNRVTVARKSADGKMLENVMKDLDGHIDSLIELSSRLPYAKAIIPGEYDIITDSSISGLICHEAFGHGLEMDQFVKDRAVSKQYMGKKVAAKGVYMKDGASNVTNVASYFFDDDGVIAQETLLIKDGILVSGMCDLTSSTQLGIKPTGNSRRQAHDRKAYTRMTNTYFEKGTDKLEDMIKSIKHGYMLFNTDNGMEDPKNWGIQCVCQYGREIIDGKLTDNYVAPVIMSGFVLDLLESITMISDELLIDGNGFCGKGYKEFVRVSDGGPALKARAKLG